MPRGTSVLGRHFALTRPEARWNHSSADSPRIVAGSGNDGSYGLGARGGAASGWIAGDVSKEGGAE